VTLDGKNRRFVTGEARGIGKAISQALAAWARAWPSTIALKRAAAKKDWQRHCRAATTHKADVGDPAQVEAMVKEIGRVDHPSSTCGPRWRDKLLIQMARPTGGADSQPPQCSAFATTSAAIMSHDASPLGPDRQNNSFESSG